MDTVNTFSFDQPQRNDDLEDIRYHEAQIAYHLVRVTLPSDDILEKLIPSARHDVQKGYRGDAERLSVSYGILLVRERHHPGGGYQLGDGEEQLMIPLRVEVVVPIINVNPPRVIIGEQCGREEEHHGLPQSLLHRQFRQILHRLVKRDHADDDEYPYFQHVRSGVEVHVFIGSDTGFVRAFKDSVPAGAGAVPFIHDPRVILPEII